MRLIDADAFIAEEKKLYCKDCDSYHGVRCRACSFNDIWGDLDDYADAYAVEAQRWIPVTERLPDAEYEARPEGTDVYPVLVYTTVNVIKNGKWVTQGVVVKAWYDGEGFVDITNIDISVSITHWMPLPDAPMEDT